MHNCEDFVWPKSNKEYWQSKLEKNKMRDEANIKVLQDSGWHIIVVWECELKTELTRAERMALLIKDIESNTK